MFIITFATKTNKRKVINGKPWLFDGHLFSLQNMDRKRQLAETMINTKSCWIQIHYLPFRCMNHYYGNIIGGKVEKVLDIGVWEVDMDSPKV